MAKLLSEMSSGSRAKSGKGRSVFNCRFGEGEVHADRLIANLELLASVAANPPLLNES
jgi:hypothetical protein